MPGTVLNALDSAVGHSVKVPALRKPEKVNRQLQQMVMNCDKHNEESKPGATMNYRE